MQSIFHNSFSNPQDEPENTTISAYQSLPKPKKDTVGLTFTDPFAWAIGIFEGEGCLSYSQSGDNWEMSVEMTDMDVLWSYYEAIGCVGNLTGLKKDLHVLKITNHLAGTDPKRDLIRDLIIRFYPYMHERRRAKCDEFFSEVPLQKMKLLIDADFIVYKCCAAAESEIDWGDDVITVVSKFSEAYRSVVN